MQDYLQGAFSGGLLARLAIDLVCAILLIRGVYYRTYRHAELFLTFFSFNLVIFLIAFVLNSAELSMGAAFGLFAVFSMLRYRTEAALTRVGGKRSPGSPGRQDRGPLERVQFVHYKRAFAKPTQPPASSSTIGCRIAASKTPWIAPTTAAGAQARSASTADGRGFVC